MTAIASRPSPRRSVDIERRPRLLPELSAFLRQFLATAFHSYRPELHYMRGPGPAWRAKHDRSLTPPVR